MPARPLPAPSGAALRAKAPPFGYPAPLYSAGTREPVLQRRAVGVVGLLQKLRDLILEQLHLRDGVAVAHRRGGGGE